MLAVGTSPLSQMRGRRFERVIRMPFIRRTSIFLSTLLLTFSSPLHALDIGQIEKRIFDLVNAERARRNLPPYTHSPELASLARRHSRNMARHRFFSHTAPESKDTPARKQIHFPSLFASLGENLLVRGKARSGTAGRT